jgi:hypothetical protein
VRRAVGKTDAPLHSYFALVADDPSVQVVSIVQLWYIEQMMEGTEHDGLPILSAAAPFKAGGRGGPEYFTDVPAGDVAIKNVSDLSLYPNTARAVRVTGQQVKDWLERSAAMFNQVEVGAQDVVLLNPSFPSYNFDVIDGVNYQIDLSQPSKYDSDGELLDASANRIINLTYNGNHVDMTAEFIIATNNYRAGGGGGNFPGATSETTVFEGPDTNRDVIVRYIVEKGTISPRADNNWSFAPMEGTIVLFDTGLGVVKDKSARFVLELENDYKIRDPAAVNLVRDVSPGLIDTKLFLEAAFRSTPTTKRQPLTFGKAAIDDLAFQHVPVEMALAHGRSAWWYWWRRRKFLKQSAENRDKCS